MSVDRVLRIAAPLIGSIDAVAALGAALRLRLDGGSVDQELAGRLTAVLDALDVRGAFDELDDAQAASLLALIEGSLAQAAEFAGQPRAGWAPDDMAILVAQGNTSALLAGVFASFVVPALGGELEARLAGDGASFLDVGVGVAALAVAMCRVWPTLAVVGLDPWDRALALGRARVDAAGLSGRIELRQAGVEELTDACEHDLAWLPAFFIRGNVLGVAIERTHAALRPGGGVIVGLYARPGDPVGAAVVDLRTVRQGGSVVAPDAVAGLLSDAGFVDATVLSDPLRPGPLVFVVGRRAGPSTAHA